ncbi:MAG: fibronectin type III domain-containing protein [Phycisphaerae bacterium]
MNTSKRGQTWTSTIALLASLITCSTAWAAPRDRTPPTTPTNLHVTAVSPTSVSLAWSPSSDDSGSFFYVLYANNAVVANASMTATTTTLTGLNPSTAYTFLIRARDQALNWSGYSNAVTATTLPADTPPDAPMLSVASVGPTHISLAWTAPANGAPPFRYWIYRDGEQILAWHQTNAITFYLVEPGKTHTYTVQVRSGTGQFSAHSNAVTVTTPKPDPNDHTPPSTPTNLSEMHFGDAEFWLSWTESTDNVTPQDFIRYDVYVNGELTDILVGTGARSINYGNFGEFNTVKVIAVDEAGNKSEPATLTFLL